MAVTTAHDFLQLVEKSRLLSAEQMAQVRTWPERDADSLAERLVAEAWITPWQKNTLLAGKAKFFLGKYKLLDILGYGGMGAVYKAVAMQPAVGRVVALKVMNRAVLKQPKALQRFLREIQSAAVLNDPHIVHAYDANQDGEIYFLVMEFVSGRNLKSWIQQEKSLPIGWSCECIRQAALGLQHAFEQGMVHRDIKPSNLLVTQNEVDGLPLVKILDFGLARFASETRDEGELTRSGQVLGTPDYIAPEQASNTRAADIRADIFSLGCTLFEMLTARLPFGGETVMEKLMARASRDAPPIRSLRPDVPTELEAVIARMLARNPQARYTTPAEVAQALAPFAVGTARLAAAPIPNSDAASPSHPAHEANGGRPIFDFLEEATIRGFPADATRVATREEFGAGSGQLPEFWRRPRVQVSATIAGALLIALLAVSLLPGSKRTETTGSNTRSPKKRHAQTAENAAESATVASNVAKKNPERAVALRVLELGGTLAVSPPSHKAAHPGNDEKSSSRTVQQVSDLPKGELRITAVDLHGHSLEITDLTRLSELAHLAALNLAGTDVTDQPLENLRKLTTLTHLDLRDTPITDSGVARLKELTALESLQLARTKVTGAALESLRALPNLSELSLQETYVGDPDLRHLGTMSQLHVLNLAQTRVKGPGLRFLRPMKELTWLDLSGLPMQGPAFNHLSALGRLRYLRLTGARVKDDDLAHLSGMTNLRELFLASTSIAGPGLKHLTWMAELETLDLGDTVVGDAGLKFLSGLSSLKKLDLHGSTVSDLGLDALRPLSRLESLNLADTKVSAKGVESLKKSLVNCAIEY